MFEEKLAVIIPTKDRPSELSRLLESICTQKIKPLQVIIIDGGSRGLKDVLNMFSELDIDYANKIPASLTAQRNIGIRMLKKEVLLVAFLDDDTVLDEDSLYNMLKFWENVPENVGGVSFNITTESFKKPSIFEKIFLVNTDCPGRVLQSGFLSLPSSLGETTPVEYLIGCAMVFRKEIFTEFMFDEWFAGYARYEDVDFSYRVGKKYKLFIVADAKIKHFIKLERIEDSFTLGKMEVINRLYFVKKNPCLSVLLCYWAHCGLFLNNLIKGVLGYDRRYRLRAKGNIAGFIEILSRKNISETG